MPALSGPGRGRSCLDDRRRLPTIFPVRYAILDDNIVFRTAAGTSSAAAVQDAVVAFEIDDIDPWSTTGWSIVVVGHAREITGPDQIARAERLPLNRWQHGASRRPCSGSPPRSSTDGPSVRPAMPCRAERRPDHGPSALGHGWSRGAESDRRRHRVVAKERSCSTRVPRSRSEGLGGSPRRRPRRRHRRRRARRRHHHLRHRPPHPQGRRTHRRRRPRPRPRSRRHRRGRRDRREAGAGRRPRPRVLHHRLRQLPVLP